MLMPSGSAMCIFHVTARSMRCWASWRVGWVKSWELHTSSHIGEWQLKSPSHMSMGVGVLACLCLILDVSR